MSFYWNPEQHRPTLITVRKCSSHDQECPLTPTLAPRTTSHPPATPSFLYLKLWALGESADDSSICV